MEEGVQVQESGILEHPLCAPPPTPVIRHVKVWTERVRRLSSILWRELALLSNPPCSAPTIHTSSHVTIPPTSPTVVAILGSVVLLVWFTTFCCNYGQEHVPDKIIRETALQKKGD